MPYCNKCGKQVNEGERFCFSCGAPVETDSPASSAKKTSFCQFCGSAVDSSATICPNCGKNMTTSRQEQGARQSSQVAPPQQVAVATVPKSSSKRPGRNLPFDPARDMVQGESLESEMTIHPLSQFRSYVVGALLVVAGVSFFVEQAYALVAVLVVAYFIYASSFQSAGGFVKSFIKIILKLFGIYVVVTIIAAITTFFNTGGIGKLLSQAFSGSSGGGGTGFSFANLVSVNGFFLWINGMIHLGFTYAAPYMTLITGLILAGGIWTIFGSYRYTKGQRVFFTDRRVIILKKFGGSSMFQATMDAVSDVSSNRGIAGRLFGYGAIYVTTESGSGVAERDSSKKSKLGRALGGVKLTVDGVRNPEEAVNIFGKIRMKYMDSLHLMEIEKYAKSTAEALQRNEQEKQRITLTADGNSMPVAVKTFAVEGSKCTWCSKSFTNGEQTYSCPRCKRPFHTFCLEGALAREKACPECGAQMMVP
ncbi:MAG: zinc-ribbon domain-containing protein [Nitrososphaerota archaeon]|nr:zinc-ribbon domain-containing protein [Nitrososphaerota archaeon]